MIRACFLLMVLAPNALADDAPKRSAPAEQLKLLSKQYKDIEETFLKELRAARTQDETIEANVKRNRVRNVWRSEALAVLKTSAALPEALDVIAAVLKGSSETAGMTELLRKHHLAHPDLGKLFLGMVQGRTDDGRKFVEEVAENSPVPAVRGQAALALGWQAKWRITRDGEALLGFGTKLTDGQRKGMEARAEKYLAMAMKYTDAPLVTGAGTVAAHAKAELAGLKNLAFLRVGEVAPDITGEAIDGTKFKLSDSRGKVTVVVFWASWCAPCMRMVPHEKKRLERMRGKPFALVGINGDEERRKANEVAQKNEMTWPSFWNGPERAEGPITKSWNVSVWPTIYVLDAEGVVRFVGTSDEKLDAIVDELIGKVKNK
ncbi:thiol-disulfide isomerase-like thioredoxin : Thiol-disulfide isomerase-like thioredoxin OS=Singulisphaera acidiphila (strain ATCC BAA-1392 / DSM 18658 / VKM B-2454 / MOB10) GN=Sinac_5190 PE=4 SV=1: AhpC-TSA [Gemmata massiliana]|uniref:Thioredoxin domain-containing protein n=1 Tax=Gemmata massiliana TaxID=1210884 RepID=A0A6P2CWK4_9BACT|nr:TlpA disulfide reductase family protein [Gemmata massiliana]VTR93283.1 thiol-disulfide isomerase-like thioredoxin : Thiol-disulfide isomerase-like thioredoxin OS=Singulisphaera acidiphila (strain ATCC BAA-1392 / DSM 18658 / VKM B-2454 / MOB10) GN=Sinac_5190 PE=4 SV=1: AhpC-TSA [Gemmata massiliana]